MRKSLTPIRLDAVPAPIARPRESHYDPAKYGTYLEQLGITYPTLKK